MMQKSEKVALLLAAAKDNLARDQFIFPLHEDQKTPFACSVDADDKPLRWYNGISSFYSASDGGRREYVDQKTGKKRLTTIALDSWLDGIPNNIGVALECSNLTSVDIDEGIDSEAELKEFLAFLHVPESRAVRSGRVSSFGVHIDFQGAMESGSFIVPWKDKVVKGEIKSRGCIVVGAGSFHKSGQRYTWLWDIPLQPTPVSLFQQILADYSAKKPYESGPTEHYDGAPTPREDFESWLEIDHDEDIEYVGFNKNKQAHEYIRVQGCPWKDVHTGQNGARDFAIYFAETGMLSVKCVHTTCQEEWTEPSGWKSYKAFLTDRDGYFPMQGGCILTFGR